MTFSYEQAEDHVLGLEQFGMRFGLERIKALLVQLGSPQDAFESIHVVGSNGKSSTVRMTAAILTGHGVHTGAYLSPHLHGFNERIRIDDRDVGRQDFAAAVERVAQAAAVIERDRAPDDLVTQFETLTAAAFLLLADARVEVAVIEAGLGGRHDATNVLVRSRVQVLTNIALEHTQWLGDTIAAIAGEKVAVVRPGATLVIGSDLHPDAMAVAEQICAERGAEIVVADGDSPVELAAGGEYQHKNFALAETVARQQIGQLDPEIVAAAGASVLVPGRFDVRPGADGQATVVLDGAHNPDGVEQLTIALERGYPGRRVVGVISILQDKDADAMLGPLLSAFDAVVCTNNSNPRSVDAGALAERARRLGADPVLVPEPHEALARGRELAGADGVAVATGSLYLLADLERPPGSGRVSTL